ncbi:NRDC protein, partial [Acromyrmex heyeri]
MVFMESEKYPEVLKHDNLYGGTTDSATDCEYTRFYFDISVKQLKSAFDHFVQFFIDHPSLMKKDAITREARLPLDTLEKYITDSFAGIVSNWLSFDTFTEFEKEQFFDTVVSKNVYKIRSIKDINQVCILDMQIQKMMCVWYKCI